MTGVNWRGDLFLYVNCNYYILTIKYLKHLSITTFFSFQTATSIENNSRSSKMRNNKWKNSNTSNTDEKH